MDGDIPLFERKNKIGAQLSVGSCLGEPRDNALSFLKSRQLTAFTDTISEGEGDQPYPLPDEHWINQPIPDEDMKTLLDVAVDNSLSDFVDVLLQAGANAALLNPVLGKAPIHNAVVAQSTKLLPVFFKYPKNSADVNAITIMGGTTALHMAVEQDYLDGVEFLLRRPDIDINVKDKKRRQTPTYIAAKGKNEIVLRKLIALGGNLDDVCFGKKVSDVIGENFPNLDVSTIPLAKKPRAPSSQDELVSLVEACGLEGNVTKDQVEDFRRIITNCTLEQVQSMKPGGYTLLQKTCEKGLEEFVSALLQKGVNPNETTQVCRTPPLLIAANKSHLEVIKLLQKYDTDFTLLDSRSKETFLHRLFKNDPTSSESFLESLNAILTNEKTIKDLKRIINRRDENQETALHYATQKWPQQIIRSLLELGANIGMKNQWDEVPIGNILPSTMEAFLDEYCLNSKNDVNHPDFEVTFNYSFLAPPKEDLPAETLLLEPDDPESQRLADEGNEPKLALPETQSLWYMGQSKDHRHLLKHPVVTSFLHLKWLKIRKFYNRNVRFYLLFVFLLTWYIFQQFGAGVDVACSEETLITNEGWRLLFVVFSVVILVFILRDWMTDIRDVMRIEELKSINPEGSIGAMSSGKACLYVVLSNWIEVAFLLFLGFIIVTGAGYLKLALGITLLILIVREFFQVTVSLKRYVFSPENWMEVGMIILVSIILLYNPEDCPMAYDIKRTLSSFAIILSWAELITLVGKHPKLTQYNIYVTMFYKVMGTFFFFLSWYAFFIVAFGLAFYIMLHKQPEDTGEDDYIFFNSPWLALVKTSTMFVGELEFSDIPINIDNSLLGFLGYIFFLSFVFLIVVVLMNLLNGLAVSDTGIIQEKAEIVSYISRVETISYTESVLLGDPFNFLSNWPALKWIINLPSCSICGQLYRSRVIKQMFHKITGATGILLFYNYLPKRQLTLKPNDKKTTCLDGQIIDYESIKAATKIVLRKKEEAKEQEKEDMYAAKLQSLEDKINLLLKMSTEEK